MSKTFKTNPRSLKDLLRDCGEGKIQLPDFQRSWVWAEDRILSLIASISRSFPVGALMTLESNRGDSALFARRPIQGAPPEAEGQTPAELLLDGQQRMTSMYQSCFRREVVQTITPKNKVVRRWFYIDILKALQPGLDRDEAIFAVPEDRLIKTNFDKDVLLDLSTSELEYKQLMFPLMRYNIYTLDYGTYVDLRNTSKEPQFELLPDSGEDTETVVPFDDKRSIRRIVLTEAILDQPSGSNPRS